MKQLIVLVSTVILGIAIGVMIMSFQTQAQGIKNSVGTKISEIVDVYSNPGTGE